MLETIRQINKPSSVLLTQTRYGTRSLRHAEEFLAENGLAMIASPTTSSHEEPA